MHVVETPDALVALADMILDPGRRNPLVVLSVRSRDRRAGFDPYEVDEALSGSNTDVYVMADPWYGGRLGNLTNGHVTCFNGAAAVVPPYGASSTFLADRDDVDMIVDTALRHASFDRPRAMTAIVAATDESKRLKTENARLRKALRNASTPRTGRSEDVMPPADAYPSGLAADWLDLAVRVTWARLIPACDKTSRPLPAAWSYGDGMAERLHADPDAAVLAAMARVLVGLDRSHALRAGLPGAPVARGAWGNPVWRVYVRQNTPDAPRLHYTRDDEGRIVFLDYGGHDDLI